MSDSLPGFPARVAGHIRLGMHLDSDQTNRNRQSITGSARNNIIENDARSGHMDEEGFGTNFLRRTRFDEVNEGIDSVENTHSDLLYFISPTTDLPKSGQRITIYVHNIWNLPTLTILNTTQKTLPVPYISIKTAQDAASGVRAKLVTHTAQPGQEATFAEKFTLEFEESFSSSSSTPPREIFISILDENSKRYIAKFVLPIPTTVFTSHRQQTLVLRSVSTVHKEYTPSIRISVLNEDRAVTQPTMLQQSVDLPFSARCIAVVKVVHSSSEYVAKMDLIEKRIQEGCPTTFPQLAPITQLDFDSNGTLIRVSRRDNSNAEANYYQMTLSSPQTTKPEWNHHFVFFINMLLFNAESSVVVEFYRDPVIMENRPLSGSKGLVIDDLIGYSIIPLGDFSIISAAEKRKVLNLDKVKVFFTGVGGSGGYGGSPYGGDTYCSLDLRVPDTWNQINPDSLKPKTTSLTRSSEKRQAAAFRGSFEQLLEMLTAAAVAAEGDTISDSREITFKNLIDRLLQELENRSLAIQKLGLDIVAGKERNAKLETYHTAELQRRYTSMADRLSSELAKTKDLLQRVESSNLILMERNDFEKRYLELQQAHMAQQNLVQRLQRDKDVLQDSRETIRKQENVIEKLGTYLKERMPANMQGKITDLLTSKEPQDMEANLQKMLSDENLELKKRVMELEKQLAEVPESDHRLKCKDSISEEDYYEVLMRAESNETRIVALEQELSNNAREFAKQLAQMQKKLLMASKDSLSRPVPSIGALKEDSARRSPEHIIDDVYRSSNEYEILRGSEKHQPQMEKSDRNSERARTRSKSVGRHDSQEDQRHSYLKSRPNQDNGDRLTRTKLNPIFKLTK
ncbi:hypothetical protein BDR26DRAFT_863224 [Obelidium mucronatum]|nr:hypothetical protein BDR26DRAFT_863224 [Obelidium mucronatum]